MKSADLWQIEISNGKKENDNTKNQTTKRNGILRNMCCTNTRFKTCLTQMEKTINFLENGDKMAIGYCRLEFVKRSLAKNVVLKASYCSRMKMYFEGNVSVSPHTYDWSHIYDKPLSHTIFLPDYVDARFKDPEVLWNYVEKCEKRKDAQVGCEVLVALPDDFVISNEERIEMAESFAMKYFVSKGYGVQVNVHPPRPDKIQKGETEDEEIQAKNFHAHILITSRHFAENGQRFSYWKSKDLLPEVRGKHHIAFNGIEWGKVWTQFQNEYFESKGLSLRVDQQSIIPQIHLGPVRLRGEMSSKGLLINDRIAEKVHVLSKDPLVLLDKITDTKSVFTDADFEKILSSSSLSTTERAEVREAFWALPELVHLYDKGSHNGVRKFTSWAVIEEEKKILRLSDRIAQQKSDRPGVVLLSFLSVKETNPPTQELTNEQLVAFEKIIQGNNLVCIEGLAGTGKSYLLVALKEYYTSNGFNVRGFGPDNATVKVLQEKGFKQASTVHSKLYKHHFSRKKPIQFGKEVWIVDESGKLGNKALLELLKLAVKNDIKVIFSGNTAQLSSVDRGGMFKVFCDRYGYAYLGDIQRQKFTLDRQISKNLATGDVSQAIATISKTGGFVWCENKFDALSKAVLNWAEDKVHFPYGSSLIIAHTNEEVCHINELVHSVRRSLGEVDKVEFECKTTTGNIRVSVGDLIEIREKNKKLKLENGQTGILIKAVEDKFVVLTEGRKVSFNPRKFNAFSLGYAITYFRSQGRTIDRCYVVYNKYMNQKLLYVGMSRHVRSVKCFVSHEDAKCVADIKNQLMNRQCEVDNTLNYTNAFEIRENEKHLLRDIKVRELCEADNFLSQAKGLGFKAWDQLKSKVSFLLEAVSDVKADKDFYVVPTKEPVDGSVVKMKEEEDVVKLRNLAEDKTISITSNMNLEKPEQRIPLDHQTKQSSSKSTAYQQLSDEKKKLYRAYFEKNENASTVHAIVQSESAIQGISKEAVSSFKLWQEACAERNLAAYSLIKGGVDRKVFGEKGIDILFDYAGRHERSLQPKESIETQLRDNLDGLLYRLFPEGPQRKDSRGFRFGNKGSLSVICVGEKAGCFYDHENKEGGSLLQLIQKKEGLNREEAIGWANSFLKGHSTGQVPAQFSTQSFVAPKEQSWVCITPPAQTSVPPLGTLSPYLASKYKIADVYPYHRTTGELVFHVLRLEDKSSGEKLVLPLSFGKSHPSADPRWHLKAHPARCEVLYNGQKLAQFPKKPVLVVEGEKTAKAAEKLVGKEYVVVTWVGGAGAAKMANWGLLSNREVIIWPDNDIAGFKAANDIIQCLKRVGVNSLKAVSSDSLKDLPAKWDLADPIPTGKGVNFIQNTLLRAESKAIGTDRLEALAAQHKLSVKELNECVCNIDDRMRPELEKKFGSKTWEIENAILAETVKSLQERHMDVGHSHVSERSDKFLERGDAKTKSVEHIL